MLSGKPGYAMTWYVKAKFHSERVAAILFHDLSRAERARDEFRQQGHDAWIEGLDRIRVEEASARPPKDKIATSRT
jgi:hypothetical protein